MKPNTSDGLNTCCCCLLAKTSVYKCVCDNRDNNKINSPGSPFFRFLIEIRLYKQVKMMFIVVSSRCSKKVVVDVCFLLWLLLHKVRFSWLLQFFVVNNWSNKMLGREAFNLVKDLSDKKEIGPFNVSLFIITSNCVQTSFYIKEFKIIILHSIKYG